jgi:hypothetical protein
VYFNVRATMTDGGTRKDEEHIAVVEAMEIYQRISD